MSKIAPLIVFGVALTVCGAYWVLWEDSSDALDDFVIEDVYYTLINWIWGLIPIIILFVGIMCLIAAGIGATRREVYYE